MVRARRSVAACAVCVALWSAACGSGDDGPGDDETSPPPTTTEPIGTHPTTTSAPAPPGTWDPEAEFTLAWTIGPSGFDPHIAAPPNVHYSFMAPIYDRLTMLSTDGSIEPMLARSWEYLDGGSVLRLELRDDVTFHDGTPFDAHAVVANIERAKTHPESTAAAQQLEPVVGMEVVDDHTVHLEVTEDAAFLPFYFATPTGMMVSPAAFDADLALEPVGAGPYVLERYEDDEAVYVRAPGDYWDPDAQKVARFTLRGIADNVARINAVQTGEAQIANIRGEAVGLAAGLGGSADFQIVSYPSATLNSVLFNRDSPALGDVRVRQALAYAIDHEAIRDELLGGECLVTGQPLLPDWDGYRPEYEDAYRYDPELARELLDEAGVSDLTLTGLQYAGIEPAATIAVVVQEQLAQIGVTLELEAYESQELASRWYEGDGDLWIAFFSSLPDPGLALERRVNDETNPGDLANFSQRLVGAREDLYSTRLQPAEREALYQELVAEIVEQAVEVHICFAITELLATREMIGVDDIPYAVINIFDTRYLGVRADE